MLNMQSSNGTHVKLHNNSGVHSCTKSCISLLYINSECILNIGENLRNNFFTSKQCVPQVISILSLLSISIMSLVQGINTCKMYDFVYYLSRLKFADII